MGDAASAAGVRSEESLGGGTDVRSDADAGVRSEESPGGGTDVWSDAGAVVRFEKSATGGTDVLSDADAGVRSEESPGGGTDLRSDAYTDAGVRFEKSATGGTDVWSDAADACPADHLLVMVHGILGSTADWQYGAKQFVESLGEKIVVHCSERNMYRLTLDGVDVMGERLAEEVLEVVKSKPEVTKISFVAHSVGGLVARYAIGRLYRPIRKLMKEDVACDDTSNGTICGLEPMNFITVATPHLGSRGNNQVPLLFGVTAVEKVASRVVHWIFRRTGRHLFLTDNGGGQQPPLLQRMVDDCGDLYFMSALRAFKRRVVYANVGYDRILYVFPSRIYPIVLDDMLQGPLFLPTQCEYRYSGLENIINQTQLRTSEVG